MKTSVKQGSGWKPLSLLEYLPKQRETARGREEVRFTRRTLDPFRKERYLETRIQVRDALIAPRVSHSLSLFLGPGGPVYMFVQVCVCVCSYTLILKFMFLSVSTYRKLNSVPTTESF